MYLFKTSVPPSSSATATAALVQYLPPPSPSPSSTCPASIPLTLPTVNATQMVPASHPVSSYSALGGFLLPGGGRTPPSHFVSSISSINFSPNARLTCTTSMRRWSPCPTMLGCGSCRFVSPTTCLYTRNLQYFQNKYNELSLVFRIYVYLRQLRRGGATHTVGGLSAIREGGLAVECPACPQPGRNITLQKEGLITRPP